MSEEIKAAVRDMDSDTAISVRHLSKVYKLYKRNRDRFIESLGLSKKRHCLRTFMR